MRKSTSKAASPQHLDSTTLVINVDRDQADRFVDALLDSTRVCGAHLVDCYDGTIEQCAYLAQLLREAMGAGHA